jgi:hypothetical protein
MPDPNTGVVYVNDMDGLYMVPIPWRRDHDPRTLPPNQMLVVIASQGLGWDHVSVSLNYRCPTWEEMEYVRELFFADNETVMQLSVPRSDHLSYHPYCLHLWRPQTQEIPRPPDLMVAPKSMETTVEAVAKPMRRRG